MPKHSSEDIRTLPEAVQDNYYSAEIMDRYAEEVFPLLADEQVQAVKDAVMDVYYRAIPPSSLYSALLDIVKDDALAKRVTVKILGYDLLPIADYLGVDVSALIVELGGDPLVFRRRVPVRDVVEQVLRRSGLPETDERLEYRLMNIVRTYVVGARKDDQMLEVLTGNAKTSGIGLSTTAAQGLLAAARAEREALDKRGVDIVPDEEYDRNTGHDADHDEATNEEDASAGEFGISDADIADSVVGDAVDADTAEVIADAIAELPPEDVHELAADVMASAPVAAKGAAPSRSARLDAFDAEDEREIVVLKKRAPDVVVVGGTTTLEDGVAHEVLRALHADLPDEDMRKRFLYAVRLYLRDIRDALETLSKLTMPATSGGVGLSDVEAARIMETLKAKRDELHDIMDGRAQKAREEHVATAATAHYSRGIDRDDAARSDRDELFRVLTGKDPAAHDTAGQGVAALSPRMPVPKPTVTVVPVVGVDTPTPKPASAPVASVPAPIAPISQPGSVPATPPTPAASSVAPTPVASTPKPEPVPRPVVAPMRPTSRTAPPPDELPIVDMDDDEPLVVREVGDGMTSGAPMKTGSVPVSQPPRSTPPRVAVPKADPIMRLLSEDVPYDIPRTTSAPPTPTVSAVTASGAPTAPSAPAPTAPSNPVPAPTPRPTAQRSPTPVASPIPSAKPTVSDVAYVPKLVGPVDALRSMSLMDFRRLSKDPREATLKIKDKIDLLGEESFERKTEGIKAWQASAPSALYLTMLRASLGGEPLLQVITRLQGEGKPVLTKEEFDAILDLSRDLRFG